MPNPIQLGDIEAHEKLTARAYFKPQGAAAFFDLGNVKEYKEAHEYTAVERVVAERGFRRVSDEQVDVVKMAWELTLDEVDASLMRLRGLATQEADVSQPSTAGTVNIVGVVLEQWYDLGSYGISAVVVKIGATEVPSSKYTVDAGAGKIKFTDASMANVDVTVQYARPALVLQQFRGLDSPATFGWFELFEYNQFSTAPLRITTCQASLVVTEFPTQSGEFGTWKVRVTALDKPVVLRRSAAGT